MSAANKPARLAEPSHVVTPSVKLLLSVAAELLEQAKERAEGGWFDQHTLYKQARQVLAEAIDRVSVCRPPRRGAS